MSDDGANDDGASDLRRLRELAERLVAGGPKASHVSASECHEISDGMIELIDEIEQLRQRSHLTKIHKITLYVIDHDDVGAEGVREVIESARYPNRSVVPRVEHVETRVVEWRDDHPLNIGATSHAAFEELFKAGS